MNWINRFKNRRNIVFKKLHGEASSADLTAVSYWKDNVLDIISANFQDKDICNLDETGIFYKMLPNSTHVVRWDVGIIWSLKSIFIEMLSSNEN